MADRKYYPVILFGDITEFDDYPLPVGSGTAFDNLSFGGGSFVDLSDYLWDLNYRGMSNIGPLPSVTRVVLIYHKDDNTDGAEGDYILRDENVPCFSLTPNWRSLADVDTQTASELDPTDYPFITKLIGAADDSSALTSQSTSGLEEGFTISMPKLRRYADIVLGPATQQGDVKPNDYDPRSNDKHWFTYDPNSFLKPQIMSGLAYSNLSPWFSYFKKYIHFAAGVVHPDSPDPAGSNFDRGGSLIVVDPDVCSWFRTVFVAWTRAQNDFRCLAPTGVGVPGYYQDNPVEMIPPVPARIDTVAGVLYGRTIVSPFFQQIDIPSLPTGCGFNGFYFNQGLASEQSSMLLLENLDATLPGDTQRRMESHPFHPAGVFGDCLGVYLLDPNAFFDDTPYSRAFQTYGLL